MNLKELLIAERDKTQLMAESLMHVVTSLNTTIAALDKVQLPATVELRIDNVDTPKGNAKAVGNAVPPATEFDNDEMIGGERFLSVQRIPPANTATTGQLSLKDAAKKYNVRPNTIGIWIRFRGVVGADGFVNEASLQQHLAGEKKLPAVKDAPVAMEGEMSYAEAGALIGTSATSVMKNQVWRKQLEKSRRGFVTRESVDRYLQKQKNDPRTRNAKARKFLQGHGTAPGALKEKVAKAPAADVKAEKPVKEPFRFDDPKPIVKDLAISSWEPEHKLGDQFRDEQKVAKEMNVNEDWLRMVKKSGRISGAPGWINITQLEAYMKHPDFDAPLIDKARA